MYSPPTVFNQQGKTYFFFRSTRAVVMNEVTKFYRASTSPEKPRNPGKVSGSEKRDRKPGKLRNCTVDPGKFSK